MVSTEAGTVSRNVKILIVDDCSLPVSTVATILTDDYEIVTEPEHVFYIRPSMDSYSEPKLSKVRRDWEPEQKRSGWKHKLKKKNRR